MWSSSNFLTSNLSTSEATTICNIAQYIEDYIDLVENVPNEVARHLTRLHEFNNKYYQLLEKLSKVLEILGENDFIECSNSNGVEEKDNKVEPVIKKDINERTTEPIEVKLNERKKGLKALYTLQKCLIEIQEISDEKLFIVQSMFDQLDVKARQLDYDHRNVTNSAFINNLTSNSSKNFLTLNMSSSSNQHSDSNDHNINSNCLDNLKSESEICLSKDPNHTNGSNLSHNVNNCSLSNKRSSSRRNISSSKDINSNGETSNHGKRGVKRGVKGNNQVKRNKKDNLNNSPPALYEDTPIDPDEPTYCFCEQVSYGEMIGCDNVACRIEWFHFACVSLTTKPKGKWYCPDCRGDRSNIPKK